MLLLLTSATHLWPYRMVDTKFACIEKWLTVRLLEITCFLSLSRQR
ncbi:hypothetical protein MTR67_044685 [Solanum verrucosum]|uniref:Uncharacterized protein n=1 Tax=Solanum verrucosum TaxID=315347 RepID=A0AAF0USM2_SOLVR|nr:hypothetical protein MTR67_044685 [Solanum verrucosum]